VIAFGTKTPALLIESAAKQKAGRARTTISSHQESDTNCLMPILGAVSVPDWSGKSSERPIVKSAYMERMCPGSIDRSGHASGRAINNGIRNGRLLTMSAFSNLMKPARRFR
jgi:hypothetical protein